MISRGFSSTDRHRHSARPQPRLGISRRQLFERSERQALKPLPHERFTLKSIQMARVGLNRRTTFHFSRRLNNHTGSTSARTILLGRSLRHSQPLPPINPVTCHSGAEECAV